MHYYTELRRLDMNIEIIEEIFSEHLRVQDDFVYGLWLNGYLRSRSFASLSRAIKRSPQCSTRLVMDKYRNIVYRTISPRRRKLMLSYLAGKMRKLSPRLADDLMNADVC